MPFDPTTAKLASGFDPSTAQAAPQQQQQPDPSQGGGGVGAMMMQALDMGFTGLHNAADTATFGLADKASAGLASLLSPTTGKPMSYDEALAKINANNAARNGRNPVSAVAGDAAGMMIGAGKLGAIAKGIPGVGAAMEAAEPVAGQAIKNVAKSAAVGAAGAGGYAAADDAIRNGDVNPENIALNAATGAVVAPAVSKIGTMIVKGVQNSSTKAMSLLADKLGETPDVLQKAYDNFSAATGRVPTMAELVGMKSTGELRQLAQNNPIIQGAANDAADAASAQRPRTLAQTVEDNGGVGGTGQDESMLFKARKDRMDTAMKPIRNTTVGIDQNDAGLLADPRVRAVIRDDPNLSQRVRDAVDEATDEKGSGGSEILNLGDIDSIRRGLRSRASTFYNQANPRYNPSIGEQYSQLADHIGDMGTGAEPKYKDALDQFQSDSHYLAGFKHGMAGKSIGDTSDPQLIASLGEAEGKAGYTSGVASRVANQAADSSQGATKTADMLAAGTGDSANLRGAVGQDNFQRIQDASAAEAKGSQNLKDISGRINPQDDGNPAKHIGQAAGAIAAHSPTTVVYHAAQAIPKFKKLSAPVQRQIATYLLNPKMTQQGINLLRRAGVKDGEIRNLAVALSANAGLNVGATLNN